MRPAGFLFWRIRRRNLLEFNDRYGTGYPDSGPPLPVVYPIECGCSLNLDRPMENLTYTSTSARRGVRTPSWGAALALLALTPFSLFAQSPDDGDVVRMDQFEVKGFRSSLALGIEAKRQAGQVKDVITAEEIGQFGDQNIGEALQRISGVSLTRNNGEGRKCIDSRAAPFLYAGGGGWPVHGRHGGPISSYAGKSVVQFFLRSLQ